jgi:hypothetical protein
MSLKRRALIFLLVAASSCQRRDSGMPKDLLPVQVRRTWVLRETKTRSNDDAPALIRGLGLKHWMSATYRANGEIQLSVYEMNVEASAFELMQKWRNSDGAAFYKGPYFVVARPGNLEFLQALHDAMR